MQTIAFTPCTLGRVERGNSVGRAQGAWPGRTVWRIIPPWRSNDRRPGRRRVSRGATAPDFMLPNPDGKFGRFYDRFKGNRVVLFFYPSGRDAAALGALLGFVERGAAFADAGARIVAVTRDAVAANRRLVDAHGIDFTLFSDPEGAITRGYGVDGLATLVLDRNQHVLASLPEGASLAWQ